MSISYALIGRMSPLEHREMVSLEGDEKATMRFLNAFGSRGIEGEYAVLTTSDELEQAKVHGYVRLGRKNFGDLVAERGRERLDLPRFNEALTVMGQQHAERLAAAEEFGPAAMLAEFSPTSKSSPRM